MDLPVLYCNGRNNNNNDGYDNVNANINARAVWKKAIRRIPESEMRFMLFRELNEHLLVTILLVTFDTIAMR